VFSYSEGMLLAKALRQGFGMSCLSPFCLRIEALRGDEAYASVSRIEAAGAAFKLTSITR
jgi:hypothetical protein